MNRLIFSPGPSHLYPGVKKWTVEALDEGIASISHRSPKYSEIHSFTVDELRKLLKVPSDCRIFFLGSATEAMERAIQNCVKKHCYHLVNGVFSKRFAQIAEELGKSPKVSEKPAGESFDIKDVKVPKNAEMVCLVHNETSTGASTPLETIYAVKEKYPDKLLAVDIVSSSPLAGLDLSKIDITFFSVQKCFGLPAGLGVIVVSPAAFKKAQQLEKEGLSTGSYHRFTKLAESAEKSQTPETPNVLGIYLLGKVAADMNMRKIEAIHEETDKKHKRIHQIIESHPNLSHFVTKPKYRSRTVITVEVKGGSEPVIDELKTKGIIVGSGYGKDFKHRQIRIANFPALTEAELDELARELENI